MIPESSDFNTAEAAELLRGVSTVAPGSPEESAALEQLDLSREDERRESRETVADRRRSRENYWRKAGRAKLFFG